jgi:prepilin-type N-terminal cleavage/methylation domain-containing protein
MKIIKDMYKTIHGIASRPRSRRGFTLVEMLIVIAIIGILASIVLVGLGPLQRRGRDARRIADLRSVQNSLELYFNKENRYPAASDWGELTEALTGAGIGTNIIPNDPAAGADTGSSRSYQYATDSDGISYVLRAQLEDEDNPALIQSLKDNQLPSGVGGIDCSVPNYCISL